MNIEEAYKFLSLTSDNTENERYAKYEEIRNKLEMKLAKAPTPGLKEKYRNTLGEMEQAIETIEGSLDGGDLPTLSPQHEQQAEPTPAVAPEPRSESAPRSKPVARKSKSSEFGVIAAVVIVIIAGGGWFWQNQVAMKAEQAAVENFMINVARGRTEEVEIALSSSLPLDLVQTDEAGDTPLFIATHSGHTDIVRLLLAHRSVITNPRNDRGFPATSSGFSPAQTALLYQSDEMFELFIRSGRLSRSEINYLLVRASEREVSAVKLLLSVPGVDVNVGGWGSNALTSAAENGNKDVVQLLLSHPEIDVNVNADTADENGGTALTYSVFKGHDNVVKLLLSHPEIDVNKANTNGDNTALMIAVLEDNEYVVKLLLSHPKIDVNQGEPSALYYATQLKRNEIIKLLKAAGANR